MTQPNPERDDFTIQEKIVNIVIFLIFLTLGGYFFLMVLLKKFFKSKKNRKQITKNHYWIISLITIGLVFK